MTIQRITRTRHLRPEEAAQYREIREQVAQEHPELAEAQKLPLIDCIREARPDEEMTPERVAEVLVAEEAASYRPEGLKDRRSAPDLTEAITTISRRCRSLPDLDDHSAAEILGHDEKGAFGS